MASKGGDPKSVQMLAKSLVRSSKAKACAVVATRRCRSGAHVTGFPAVMPRVGNALEDAVSSQVGRPVLGSKEEV